jgi:hypothetical protein
MGAGKRRYVIGKDGTLERVDDGRNYIDEEVDYYGDGGIGEYTPERTIDVDSEVEAKPSYYKGYRIEEAPILKPRRVAIRADVAEKMFAYILSAPGEISGFAKTEPFNPDDEGGFDDEVPSVDVEGDVKEKKSGFREWEGKTFRAFRDAPPILITDIKIFEQKCSSGRTHLDPEALTKFMVALIRGGEDPARWNCWWHSHNDFSVFFSGTDTATIRELSKRSTLVSICGNKMGDMVARLDRESKHLCHLKPVVLPDIRTDIFNKCANEVRQKVKEMGANEFYQAGGVGGHGKSFKKWRKRNRRWRRG